MAPLRCWRAAGARAGFGAGGGGFAVGGAPLPAAAAAALTSSPSSARTAMSVLTGTSWVPSGTTILASVPSSIASYSIVALSVSISAMTSPGLTLSPSFLSHLARLPFSIVGDSAGIRILTGMSVPPASADRAGGAGIGRRIHFGIEHRADALERLVLGQLGSPWRRCARRAARRRRSACPRPAGRRRRAAATHAVRLLRSPRAAPRLRPARARSAERAAHRMSRISVFAHR